MKQEQVIELGKKHTTIETRGDAWFSLPVWALANLITEVEQATLERAAQACEQSEAYRGSVFAARIRAIKEDTCE